MKNKGWTRESEPHQLASKGIPSNVLKAKQEWDDVRSGKSSKKQLYSKMLKEYKETVAKAEQALAEKRASLNNKENAIKIAAKKLSDETAKSLINLDGYDIEYLAPELKKVKVDLQEMRQGEYGVRDESKKIFDKFLTSYFIQFTKDLKHKTNTKFNIGFGDEPVYYESPYSSPTYYNKNLDVAFHKKFQQYGCAWRKYAPGDKYEMGIHGLITKVNKDNTINEIKGNMTVFTDNAIMTTYTFEYKNDKIKFYQTPEQKQFWPIAPKFALQEYKKVNG